MNTRTVTPHNSALRHNAASAGTTVHAPRELTDDEIQMVSGGLSFAIQPFDWRRVRYTGGRSASSYAGEPSRATGAAFWRGLTSVWGEEEAASR